MRTSQSKLGVRVNVAERALERLGWHDVHLVENDQTPDVLLDGFHHGLRLCAAIHAFALGHHRVCHDKDTSVLGELRDFVNEDRRRPSGAEVTNLALLISREFDDLVLRHV